MHRLFIAIDLPEAAKHAVYSLKSDLNGARWVPQEQLHLTLRFIGDTDEAQLERLRKELTTVRCSSFALELRSVGHFPPRGMPRVLWVGVGKSLELSALQAAVELACLSAGIAPDERRFSPHLTIARLKETPLDGVRQFETGHAGFRGDQFQVSDFHLYESSLSQHGAVHRSVGRYPLASS